MTQYYFHDGSKEQGPFDINQIKSKALPNSTPFWHEGLENWTTVGKVEELRDTSSKTPPSLTSANLQSLPPQYSQTALASPAYSDMPRQRRNPLPIFLTIFGVLCIGLIIWWAVSQNSKNADQIKTLEDKVVTQDSAAKIKDSEEAAREAERSRKNDELTSKNMAIRNNWSKYIQLTNDEPTINYALGGISAFDIYISNESGYLLDQVDVNIQYIRKNGQLYQSKSVSLTNLSSGSYGKVEAPSSINGVKVVCTIERIVSKKLHFCYPDDNGNPKDPNFCK